MQDTNTDYSGYEVFDMAEAKELGFDEMNQETQQLTDADINDNYEEDEE